MGILANGTNNYIAFPTPSFLPSGDESRSVAFWYRPGIIEGERSCVCWGSDASNQAFGISSLSASPYTISIWGYAHDIYGALRLTQNELYRIVVTYDSDNSALRLYVNGILDRDVTTSNYNTNGAGYFNFFYSPIFGKTGKGVLYDVSIYDRALTTDEVRSDWGRYCDFTLRKTLSSVASLPNWAILGDDGYIYVTGWGGGVTKIDPVTRTELGDISGFSNPSGLILNYSSNVLYVANYGTDDIYYCNPDNLSITGAISGFDGPVSMCIANGFLYVANYGNDTVSKVNMNTNTIVDTISGLDGPQGVYSWDDDFIYVLNLNGTTISKISTATDTIVGTISGLSGPGQMIKTDNDYWVTNYSGGSVSKIDITSETVTKTIYGFTSPWGLTEDSRGYLWVMGEDTYQLRIVDPNSEKIIDYNADRYIKGPAFSYGDDVYIGSNGTTMFIFDTATYTQGVPTVVTDNRVFHAECNETSGDIIDDVAGNNGTVNGTTTSLYHANPVLDDISGSYNTYSEISEQITADLALLECYSESLPDNLVLDNNDRIFSGAIEAAGTYTKTIYGISFYGHDTATLTLVIGSDITEYIKKSCLRVLTTVEFYLNLGTTLDSAVDITKYVVNMSDVTEKLTKSSTNTGGVILPNMKIKLDNSLGKFDKLGYFFKSGYVNNSTIQITTNYISPIGEDILTQFIYKGLLKYVDCEWNRTDFLFEATLIPASSLLSTEKVKDGILSAATTPTFADVIYKILNRQPFTKYLTIDSANIELGWDVDQVDQYSDMTGTIVKTVLDNIMLLTGSFYYINYDQEFIVEPIETDSPSSVCTFRGEDIIDVKKEEYDWQSHYTGIKWDDDENTVQHVEMTYTDRELYQYDYNELKLTLKYITDSGNRSDILNNLLDLYKYLKRQVKITCKWNPEVLVNTYVKLDVAAESIIRDEFLTWNENQWNDGKYWGLNSPGISFNSAEYWRVVEVKRSIEGYNMDLVLVQYQSDDEV